MAVELPESKTHDKSLDFVDKYAPRTVHVFTEGYISPKLDRPEDYDFYANNIAHQFSGSLITPIPNIKEDQYDAIAVASTRVFNKELNTNLDESEMLDFIKDVSLLERQRKYKEDLRIRGGKENEELLKNISDDIAVSQFKVATFVESVFKRIPLDLNNPKLKKISIQRERDLWNQISTKLGERIPAEQKPEVLRRESTPELRIMSQNANLRETNAELDAANQKLKQESQIISSQNQELKQRNASLEAQNQELRARETKARQEAQVVRGAIRGTEAKNGLLETENQDLKTANGKWRGRNNELIQKNEQLAADKAKLEQQLRAAQAEFQRLKGQPRGENPKGLGGIELTTAEVAAIRKAMARIHHPDAGGDQERMKQLNALLDTME